MGKFLFEIKKDWVYLFRQMIKVSEKTIEEMIGHARKEYPEECCGLLAGNNGIVNKIYRMTNTDQSQVSYLMDPKEQFAVFKDMRRREIEMIAIYHSHPKTIAEPSITDINLAFYPDAYYIILSLSDIKRPDIRAFKIVEGKADEVGITII